MVANLEIFKRLYLCSLTSYSLITSLADFSFTEQCYWYLQSPLNPCLNCSIIGQKSQFPRFSSFSFFLSSFFFQPSYIVTVLWCKFLLLISSLHKKGAHNQLSTIVLSRLWNVSKSKTLDLI